MDVHTKSQRSYNMSRIKSKNTGPEKVIYSLLKENGYRFRKHFKIPGKPDVAFPRWKIAIFIDGEFWHGKDFSEWSENLTAFWRDKINKNILRDKRNNRLLRGIGWHVAHYWARPIKKNPELVCARMVRFIEKHRRMSE